MQRLRDDAPTSGDPVATEMARLLEHGRRPDPTAATQQRIRHRLRADTRRPPRLAALRMSVIVALLLALTAGAGAGAWVMRETMRGRVETAQDAAVEPAPPPPAPPVVVPVPVPVRATPTEPEPALPVELVTPPAAPVAPIVAHRAPTPPPPPAVPSPARAALISDGFVALHHGDPFTALRLATDYVRENPNGSLIEEAMSLAISARVATGDPQRAASAAQDYLDRFPSGRFVELAQRTIANTH